MHLKKSPPENNVSILFFCHFGVHSTIYVYAIFHISKTFICRYDMHIHEIRLKGTYECVKCSKAENGYKY